MLIRLILKRRAWPWAFLLVLSAALALALVVAAAAWGFHPPLAGRLHPASVPLGLCALLLVTIALLSWLGPSRLPPLLVHDCAQAEPAGLRALTAAVVAVIILAFGARSVGLLPAILAAGSVAALGVPGVSVGRALLIGACLALGFSLLFVGLLRQPLPLLPWSFGW